MSDFLHLGFNIRGAIGGNPREMIPRNQLPAGRRILITLLVLVTHLCGSGSHAQAQAEATTPAKGIYLLRQRATDTNAKNYPVAEYTEFFKNGSVIKVVTPTKTWIIGEEQFAGFIVYPEPLLLDKIASLSELEPYQKEVQRLIKFRQAYPQTAPFLTPHIENLQTGIAHLSAGSIKIAGRWVSKAELKQREDAAKRLIEQQLAEKARRTRAEQEANAERARVENMLAEQRRLAAEQKRNEESEAIRVQAERKRLAEIEREAKRKADEMKARALEVQRIASQATTSRAKTNTLRNGIIVLLAAQALLHVFIVRLSRTSSLNSRRTVGGLAARSTQSDNPFQIYSDKLAAKARMLKIGVSILLGIGVVSIILIFRH